MLAGIGTSTRRRTRCSDHSSAFTMRRSEQSVPFPTPGISSFKFSYVGSFFIRVGFASDGDLQSLRTCRAGATPSRGGPRATSDGNRAVVRAVCVSSAVVARRSARVAAASPTRKLASLFTLTGPMMMNFIEFHRHCRTRRLGHRRPPSAMRVVRCSRPGGRHCEENRGYTPLESSAGADGVERDVGGHVAARECVSVDADDPERAVQDRAQTRRIVGGGACVSD